MEKITERSEKTRALLTKHYQTYPKLQTEDIFKYLFQSAFGCEHFDFMLEAWRKNGYPAVRHSEIFRSAYRPAYRVIMNCIVMPTEKESEKCIHAQRISTANQSRRKSHDPRSWLSF